MAQDDLAYLKREQEIKAFEIAMEHKRLAMEAKVASMYADFEAEQEKLMRIIGDVKLR